MCLRSDDELGWQASVNSLATSRDSLEDRREADFPPRPEQRGRTSQRLPASSSDALVRGHSLLRLCSDFSRARECEDKSSRRCRCCRSEDQSAKRCFPRFSPEPASCLNTGRGRKCRIPSSASIATTRSRPARLCLPRPLSSPPSLRTLLRPGETNGAGGQRRRPAQRSGIQDGPPTLSDGRVVLR